MGLLVVVVIGRDEMKDGDQPNGGFVKRDEPDGKDLGDRQVEEARALVEDCGFDF